jgi:hypothetical protein
MAGSNSAMRMPMMAMTTSSSTNVKPDLWVLVGLTRRSKRLDSISDTLNNFGSVLIVLERNLPAATGQAVAKLQT